VERMIPHGNAAFEIVGPVSEWLNTVRSLRKPTANSRN